MKIKQVIWSEGSWNAQLSEDEDRQYQLILLFGSTDLVTRGECIQEIKSAYPDSKIVGCTTAGEISGTEVSDNSIVANLLSFDKTRISVVRLNQKDFDDSFAVGREIYSRLDKNELRHIFILSSGLDVNGSELVRGINYKIEDDVTVSGGLAADGERFEKTYVVSDGQLEDDGVIAIGFHGRDLIVGCGSVGGWDPFGPERLVTKSKGNLLFEIDDKPSLDLYKRYLGDHAERLPAAALLFPLSLRIPDQKSRIVRTILSIDDESKSMTFAGDIPEGSYVRFMKANFNRLLDGSHDSAAVAMRSFSAQKPELAILISCVGRKLVFKQRVEEEIEAAAEVLGNTTRITGFYSYGEIAPFEGNEKCELHNQTMTVTAFAEV